MAPCSPSLSLVPPTSSAFSLTVPLSLLAFYRSPTGPGVGQPLNPHTRLALANIAFADSFSSRTSQLYISIPYTSFNRRLNHHLLQQLPQPFQDSSLLFLPCFPRTWTFFFIHSFFLSFCSPNLKSN